MGAFTRRGCQDGLFAAKNLPSCTCDVGHIDARSDGHGVLEQLGRGLFHRASSAGDADPDLLEISSRSPRATLCLTTALARHGLSDEIPARIDVALPRGQPHPRIQAPVIWHAFAVDTFDLGREELSLTRETSIGLYCTERCIIDSHRLRHRERPETAVEALRRWLRRRGSQPSTLLGMARDFPKVEPALRAALGIRLRRAVTALPGQPSRAAPTWTYGTWPVRRRRISNLLHQVSVDGNYSFCRAVLTIRFVADEIVNEAAAYPNVLIDMATT